MITELFTGAWHSPGHVISGHVHGQTASISPFADGAAMKSHSQLSFK
jgi:hypothetical protein